MGAHAAPGPNVEPVCSQVDDAIASHGDEVVASGWARVAAFFYRSFFGDSPCDAAYGTPKEVGFTVEAVWWERIFPELAEQFVRSRIQWGGGNFSGGLSKAFANHRLPPKPTAAPPGNGQGTPSTSATTATPAPLPPAIETPVTPAQARRRDRYDRAVRAFFDAKTPPGFDSHAAAFHITGDKLRAEIAAYAARHGLEVPRPKRGGYSGPRRSAARIVAIEAISEKYSKEHDIDIKEARAVIAPKHGMQGATLSRYLSEIRRGTLGQTPPPRPKASTSRAVKPPPSKTQQPAETHAGTPVVMTEEERAAAEKARQRVDYLLGRNQPTNDRPAQTPNDALWADFLWRYKL